MKKEDLILPLLILTLVILTGGIIYLRYLPKENKLNPPPQDKRLTTSKLKTFKSANLDFSVQIPENYAVTEKWATVRFDLGESYISVGRNTHSFNSLKEFLADADEKDKLEFTKTINEFTINRLPATVRDEVRAGVKARMYYIFTPEWVYIFSTNSESLYSDLDQIARSFRYTPDEGDTTKPDDEKTEIQTL